jgi:cysteinyl-tRNA synthetase
MEWDSPWGRGFPGWHIECSAMSIKYLGEHFDIHCGGVDHIPIHHTNEIAQSEAATGKKPWVNYWLHGEFLILENSRMGKSAGNFITLATLKEKGYDPIVYRYLCLGAHYRKPLTFSFDSLEHAKNSYERLKEIVIKIKEESTKNKSHPNQQIQEKYIKLFTDSINNDLNIPEALATFWIMVRDKDITPAQKYSLSIEFDKIFGLGIDHFSKEQNEEITPEIIKLLNKRENFRKNKEWEKADELRKYLNDKGIEIRDTAEGPKIETKKT